MPGATTDQSIHALSIQRSIVIAAPPQTVFDALLDELGPESVMPDGVPFPMIIEPRPGGRWYRDLGNDAGHLWGHVQVIKPPTLLEITGPLFMSYAAASHVQWRLKTEDDRTRLTVTHTAIGLIEDEHREGVSEGWDYNLQRVLEIAEGRTSDLHKR
ncbi:MAG: SRPBCC domain-containing protein [Phycisphaerales bacterium]|nr:MAG: SRPBCC domain-containing protein [Phycisphaerales bacterium]